MPGEYVKKPFIYQDKNSKEFPKAIELSKTTKASTGKVDESPGSKRTPPTSGHYELNPLMSKMLEEELQELMMKVRQCLPDDSQDEAERLVVRRFRSKAGDELRDVIGLNVTKRLLNVHNPLYVKIVFSAAPRRAELSAFIARYKVASAKRVGALSSTFAARLNNFHDFDQLCTSKNLSVGNNIRVTVKPCYQFMTRPENLRTCYDLKITNAKMKTENVSLQNVKDNISAKTLESKGTNGSKIDSAIGPGAKNIKSPEAQVNKNVEKKNISVQQKPAAAKKQNALAVTPSKTNESATIATNKTGTASVATKVATTDNKKVAAKVAPAKENVTATESKKDATKVTPAKTNIAPTENKQVTVKAATAKTNIATNENKQVLAKVAPAKPELKAVTSKPNQAVTVKQSTVSATLKQANTEKQNPTPKITPTKPIQHTKLEIENSKKVTRKVTPVKTEAATKAVSGTQITAVKSPATRNASTKTTAKLVTANQKPVNPPIKVTPVKTVIENKKKITVKPKQVSPKKRQESDFDELDDHDILAMLSGGIVLDEYIGSDED